MIKHKILLAEDDLFLGKLSQKKFEMSDFSVLFLKDGVDVLSTAKKEKPEVIVLDLIMPNKDGFEFAAELRCPVPLFTAGTDIYRSGLAKGMDKLDTASVCRVLEEMAGMKRN